jgi:hypothetical protein
LIPLLVALLAAALLPSSAAAEECLLIEDFSNGQVGEFPPAWHLRKDAGKGVYSIRQDAGRRFLEAVSRGLGIQAAKRYEWDLAAYPVLAWSWRPIEFPAGSDERRPETNDSAVSVYVVFPHSSWSVKAVKYIWSAVVPVGTRLSSSMGLTQVRVLRSGTERNGEWVAERANVLEDYRRLFDDDAVPRPSGIAVLTDSDDTRSNARGDYATFRACKS